MNNPISASVVRFTRSLCCVEVGSIYRANVWLGTPTKETRDAWFTSNGEEVFFVTASDHVSLLGEIRNWASRKGINVEHLGLGLNSQ